MDGMMERLRALAGLRPEVAPLAALFAGPTPAPERFAAVFAGLELDDLGSEPVCMAAWLSAEADYSGVPAAMEPRLRGLRRYILVFNGGTLLELRTLGERCAACGTQVLLLGNAALCLQDHMAFARTLWTAEGTVPRDAFGKAAACLQETGFTVERQGPAVMGQKKPGFRIRLHRAGDRRLWEHAKALPDWPGLLVPSDGGMLVIASQQMLEALAASEPESRVLCALMDLRRLLRQMDEAAVEALAAESGPVQLALLCYEALAPGMLPEAVLAQARAGKETAKLLRQIEAIRALPTGRRRLERVWHMERLRHPESWGAALGATGRTLGQAVLRRLPHR